MTNGRGCSETNMAAFSLEHCHLADYWPRCERDPKCLSLSFSMKEFYFLIDQCVKAGGNIAGFIFLNAAICLSSVDPLKLKCWGYFTLTYLWWENYLKSCANNFQGHTILTLIFQGHLDSFWPTFQVVKKMHSSAVMPIICFRDISNEETVYTHPHVKCIWLVSVRWSRLLLKIH